MSRSISATLNSTLLSLVLVLLAGFVIGASAKPPLAPPDPGTTGPWAVGRTQHDVVDTDRGDRALAVELWYPVEPKDATGATSFYLLLDFLGLLQLGITSEVAVDDAPVSASEAWPLIVFSHGSGGINIQSIVLMETLASHGFVVAAPNHTGNSTFDGPDDLPYEDPATDRPKDVSFLIDWLLERSADPSDPLYRAIDRKAIGVSGHSFGGFTALAMAAGFEASSFGPVPPDTRVRAIVPVSATTSSFSDEELASIHVPALFLGGTLDTAVPIDPNTTRAFSLMSPGRLFRVDVVGATHTHFANICDIAQVLIDVNLGPSSWPGIGAGALVQPYIDTCLPPAFSVEETNRIQNLYTVAFFRRYLARDSRYKSFLTAHYAMEHEPDVLFFTGIPRCGLGYELVLVVPALLALRRHRRRAGSPAATAPAA
jgi:predicted dienelactone hydrolase